MLKNLTPEDKKFDFEFYLSVEHSHSPLQPPHPWILSVLIPPAAFL